MSPIVAAQDERILRPQHPRYTVPSGRADLCTRFDAAGLELRARYQALVERQRKGDFTYLSDYPGPDIARIMGVRRIAAAAPPAAAGAAWPLPACPDFARDC
jgi:hypothetical protein